MSIDGEFDQRVDVISPRVVSPPTQTNAPIYAVTVINIDLLRASAPPLSDYESENEVEVLEVQHPPPIQQDENMCIICYEVFSDPVAPSHHDEEECYLKKEISDFCQTCKYSVHHKCIDEYRSSKINDAIKNNPHQRQQRYDEINGTFSIKCLTCAREVEKIYISINGDIEIIKTQRQSSENEYEQRRRQRERHEEETRVQMQELLQNRLQRMRRRQKCQYCKSKLCTICFSLLVVGTLLVMLVRII
jgi:hypothetical protein